MIAALLNAYYTASPAALLGVGVIVGVLAGFVLAEKFDARHVS